MRIRQAVTPLGPELPRARPNAFRLIPTGAFLGLHVPIEHRDWRPKHGVYPTQAPPSIIPTNRDSAAGGECSGLQILEFSPSCSLQEVSRH